jgi:large subunit ribosomal protein L4
MRVAVKNQAGDILEPLELNDAVFNVPMNRSLVHQAMVIYQANKRQGTHDTKTRAEVSGGGRKPWIQKHTGRARQGSTRSPQWRHGGVVFGPHPRDYRKALPRRMRRLALRCVLSEKAREHRLVCLDATDTLNGKTKSIVDLLQNLDVSGSALVVTVGTDQNLVFAANNLKKIWTLPVTQLNAEELLSRETVIMTVEAARWAEESLALEPHGRRGAKRATSDEPAAVAEPPVDETPAVEEAAAPRRRRRTTATAAAETTDESAEAIAAEPAPSETAEVMGTDTPEVAEAEPVKPPVRRRRRTAASTASAASAAATDEPVAEEPEAAASTAEEADPTEVPPVVLPEEEG